MAPKPKSLQQRLKEMNVGAYIMASPEQIAQVARQQGKPETIQDEIITDEVVAKAISNFKPAHVRNREQVERMRAQAAAKAKAKPQQQAAAETEEDEPELMTDEELAALDDEGYSPEFEDADFVDLTDEEIAELEDYEQED